MEKCAFDERMDSGLRLEKWDLMCNLLAKREENLYIFAHPRMEQSERKKKEANKRQRDQMEFILIAFLETRGRNLHLCSRQRDNFSLACSSTCSGSLISDCSLFMTSWVRQRGQKFLHLGSFLCNFHVIIFQLPLITVLCMCSAKVVYCGNKTSIF